MFNQIFIRMSYRCFKKKREAGSKVNSELIQFGSLLTRWLSITFRKRIRLINYEFVFWFGLINSNGKRAIFYNIIPSRDSTCRSSRQRGRKKIAQVSRYYSSVIISIASVYPLRRRVRRRGCITRRHSSYRNRPTVRISYYHL